MARLGRSASAKPQLCSRALLHLLRSPLGTFLPIRRQSALGDPLACAIPDHERA
jgi:hypothetical protein